jgi:penicillin-binding protein 2
MSNRWRIFDKYFNQDIGFNDSSHNPDQWQNVFVTPQDKLMAESNGQFQGSFRILKGIIILAVFALLVRLSYLQLSIGQLLFERGEENYLRVYITRALRGIIYDRNGIQLVENIPNDNAAIIPADLPRDEAERQKLFENLSTLLSIPASEINDLSEKYRFLYTPIVIKANIDHDTKLTLLSQFANQSSGVLVLEDFSRRYLPSSSGLSHSLGYLGKVSEEEWKNADGAYTLDSTIGKSGLEKNYEQYLRGINGTQKIVVDARHTKVDTLFTSAPENGCDLVTTIDANLENKIKNTLQATITAYKATGGSVVVLNPQNGQVLSIVSLPGFDNNIFAQGIRGKAEVAEYERLLNDKNTPFLNRAISGTYPPGSTFKIVTASSVLENGIVTPTDRLEAPGQISVPNQFDPTQNFIYKDWKPTGHGTISIIDALAVSSDTFFYKVSGGYQGFAGVGAEKISEFANKFGLGHVLNIDLPGEQPGLVPTPNWKKEKLDQSWVTGDTYNYAIGQGYLLTTPLQVAGFTSVIASGGKLYQPYLVKEIKNCANSSRKDPQILQQNFLQPSTLATVREGMYDTIYSDVGTAKSLRTLPFKVAGKTGTAQFNNNQNVHAWFTAFAPYDNPELVVTVMIEGGGEGSAIAVPIAKQIFQWWNDAKIDNQK